MLAAVEALGCIGTRSCWLFDMDGTLTEPVHDFRAMRRELGIPEGANTVETVWALPEPERSAKRRLLDQIGARYVAQARAQEGALELLRRLRGLGRRVGLVTRNSRANTLATLDVLGISGWFADDAIATRDDAHPAKPAPDALLCMLERWGCAPADAVMIGDAVYDLDAGRAAGTATVLIDPAGDSPLRAQADLAVRGPAELLPLLG